MGQLLMQQQRLELQRCLTRRFCPDSFFFCLQINNPSLVIITGHPTHRVAFSHRCVCVCLCVCLYHHRSFTLQRLHEVCVVVCFFSPPKCHFTGHLHGVATGMQMSTPTSRLPHDMKQLHTANTHTLRADVYSHARAQAHPKISPSSTLGLVKCCCQQRKGHGHPPLSLGAANMCSDVCH